MPSAPPAPSHGLRGIWTSCRQKKPLRRSKTKGERRAALLIGEMFGLTQAMFPQSFVQFVSADQEALWLTTPLLDIGCTLVLYQVLGKVSLQVA